MWIELHQSVHRHPKTIAAAATLRVTRFLLVGHMSALWCWALDAAPSLGGPLTAEAIAAGAEWPEKTAAAFTSALVGAGYVDDRADGLYLHDWQDYAGRLVQRREANAARMRDARARNVQRTDDARAGATVPNQTKPNRTEPEKTPDPEPPPRFSAVPSNIRTRLWEVYTQLTTRLTPPTYDEDQIKHFEDSGCTEEHITAALAEVSKANPDKPWLYFKARLGEALAKKPTESSFAARTVRVIR